MYETADDVLRELVDVGQVAVDGVILQDGDNLVVSLVMVQKSETSDRPGADDDISMGHVFLREDANIERVTVTFYVISCKCLISKLCHVNGAICSRQEAVERRYYIREFLGPVQRKISGSLVHFIFYGVSRYDLDEGPYLFRDVFPEVDSVPRMSLVCVRNIHYLFVCQ